MEELVLEGGNLVEDTQVRRKLLGKDASVEVKLVAEDIVSNWNGKDALIKTSLTDVYPRPHRDLLKITIKIFLQNFNIDGLKKGIKRALQKLEADRADTLLVAVPVSGGPLVGIGGGSSGEERAAVEGELVSLWQEVERLVQGGVVRSAGLCDVQPDVFMRLYRQAAVKPSSVQVNLKSCCVVPEDLSLFAKDNRVTLLTHSDPPELLPSETLRELLYPKLGREAGHFSVDWIVRFQVHFRERGVLTDKRYIIKLSK